MVLLDGDGLTIAQVIAVARAGEPAGIAPAAIEKMRKSRAVVERLAAGDDPVYAVNTGVGLLADVRVPASDLQTLQRNVVRSHAAGVGEPLGRAETRAMMLIRANVLAKGFSGIRPVIAERLSDLLNRGVTPIVPARGSVGASGDLAPLAHMALVLIGEGEAEIGGVSMPGGEALRRVGLEPLVLESKEGISLLNGTQAMLAVGCLELEQCERLARGRCGLRDVSGWFEGHSAGVRPSHPCCSPAPRPARKRGEPRTIAGWERDSPIAHYLPPRAGRLLAALRSAGAWGSARHAGRSAPRIRDRAERGH